MKVHKIDGSKKVGFGERSGGLFSSVGQGLDAVASKLASGDWHHADERS